MRLPPMRAVRLLALMVVFMSSVGIVAAEAPANDAFDRTWSRTDKPVKDGQVNRTWMWGPEAFTGALPETYEDAPGGTRTVQYFDKSRMEITNPGGNPNDQWYVTNGLLVVELVTGRLQLGDDTFLDYPPSTANVAGDSDDPTGPTYATFGSLMSEPPLADGAPVIQRVDRDGNVTSDPSLAARGVTAAQLITAPGLAHQVASPFWEFMTSSGTVYENGMTTTAPLFPDTVYVTGLPITEAYWAEVKVGGQYRDVLMQCFERRCLTYTPDNNPGWKVEAGNVGQHYYHWRYVEIPIIDYGPCPEYVAGDYLFVTESDNDRIQKIDLGTEEMICEITGGNPPQRFENATQVKVDDNGYIFVLGQGWMHRYNERGAFEGAFEVSPGTTDFSLDNDGNIVTTESLEKKVIIYSPLGDVLDEMGTTPGTLSYPFGVDVDDEGNIYVLDRGYRKVITFSPQGSVSDTFGGEGMASDPDKFDTPSGIAVGPDGTVYVSDLGWIKSFRIMGSAYQPIGHWGGTAMETYGGDGRMVISPEVQGVTNFLYVTDQQYHVVRVWEIVDGQDPVLLDIIGSGPGSGSGEFNEPWGIAVVSR